MSKILKNSFVLILISILLLMPSFKTNAQTNNVGMGTSVPDASAILELQASDIGNLEIK